MKTMKSEFELGDVLVKIGQRDKYVVVERLGGGDTIVLDQVWLDGKRILPRGEVLTPKRQVNYVKVGKWSGNLAIDLYGTKYPSELGQEVDDE